MASNFRAFLALAAVLSVSGAVAKTPDGETPSEETVCDEYSGAAFGLCNAYCEAMDCDDDPNADQNACDSVYEKFEARTDEAPPCEGPPTCADFLGDSAVEFDATRCKQKPGDGEIACDIGVGVAYYCNAAKGTSPEACYPTYCPTGVR